MRQLVRLLEWQLPMPAALLELLATGISAAVGLSFGLYPASRAARLNPMEALRME